MSEEPQSPRKKNWKSPSGLFRLCVIVACGAFVVALAAEYFSDPRSSGNLLVFVILSSLSVAGALVLLFTLIRWLSRWRNLKRLLFVIACLATLIALFYAEENWRGKRAWEKYKREWEAKGEKFDLVSLVPEAVPDEQNFAMTPLLKPIYEFDHGTNGVRWRDTNAYNHLHNIRADLSPPRNAKRELSLGSVERGNFADLEACRDFYRGNTNYPQPARSGTAAEDILVALGKFEAELEELGEAANTRPYSRFAVQYDYKPSFLILLPHLATMKGLSIVCQLRAIARLEAGQTGGAFADLKLGFRLSDSIRDEPILIDHLVRIAMLGINLQVVREGLVRHAWSDDQLVELETYLASVNLLAELNRAIRGERALSTSGLDYYRRQGFKFNGAEVYDVNSGDGSPTVVGLLKFMPSGWFYQNMLTIASLHQNYTLAKIDEKEQRVLPDIGDVEFNEWLVNMPARPYSIFAKLLFPAMDKASAKSARMQTYVDATRIACALERYRLANGQFPDTLDPLAPRFIDKIPNDVIDGKPLRYRKTPDGNYLIYSVGWNKTDDGGIVASPKGGAVEWEKKRGPVDPEKGDWVWRCPLK